MLYKSFDVTLSDMVPFANTLLQQKEVAQGYARIIDMPPIDSYPEPKFQWLQDNDILVYQESLRSHITLKHQLVILEARLPTDDNKSYKARANNAYTSHTSDSQVFQLKVRGKLRLIPWVYFGWMYIWLE